MPKVNAEAPYTHYPTEGIYRYPSATDASKPSIGQFVYLDNGVAKAVPKNGADQALNFTANRPVGIAIGQVEANAGLDGTEINIDPLRFRHAWFAWANSSGAPNSTEPTIGAAVSIALGTGALAGLSVAAPQIGSNLHGWVVEKEKVGDRWRVLVRLDDDIFG